MDLGPRNRSRRNSEQSVLLQLVMRRAKSDELAGMYRKAMRLRLGGDGVESVLTTPTVARQYSSYRSTGLQHPEKGAGTELQTSAHPVRLRLVFIRVVVSCSFIHPFLILAPRRPPAHQPDSAESHGPQRLPRFIWLSHSFLNAPRCFVRITPNPQSHQSNREPSAPYDLERMLHRLVHIMRMHTTEIRMSQ